MSKSDYIEHVARISYGKDSLKMLEVIHSRGLPLDRITTTDVWATDTISANLPPIDAFKERMDQRIWDMYRIEVEHLCAMNPDGSKRTYEQMFYHVPVRRSQKVQVEREREFRTERFKDSRGLAGRGVKESSSADTWGLGFPVHGTPWCQDLKRKNQGIPWNAACQMVSASQTFLGAGYQDSQLRSPRGAESSRSIMSKPLFRRAPHEAQRHKNRGVYRHSR